MVFLFVYLLGMILWCFIYQESSNPNAEQSDGQAILQTVLAVNWGKQCAAS